MDIQKAFGFTDEQLELIEFFLERRFTLEAIGITSKTVFDWSKQGLLLEEQRPKNRRMYNVMDFVWLKLVVKLREFGLSLEAIRNVRGFLLETIPFREMLSEILTEDLDELGLTPQQLEQVNEGKELYEQLKEWEGGAILEESLSMLEQSEMKFFQTPLIIILLNAVLYRKDMCFLITSDGKCAIRGSEFENYVIIGEEIENEPFIVYPVHLLLSEFVQREELVTPSTLLEHQFLTEKELQVLELLRKDNLVSLTVRIGTDREIKLIETEENIKVENATGKLTDYLMRNNYQEIVCKTQNGKITSIRRKTKHK